MILYLRYCKRYYELDRTLSNVAQQRQEVLEYLFKLSWTFDVHQFSQQAVKLMLTARRLT
jgi:hypothetical protein